MFRSLLFLSLAACAQGTFDAPADLSPPPASPSRPTLSVPTVVHGDRLTVTVASAVIGADVLLFEGTQRGAGPCYGVCLDIVQPVLAGRATVGADGLAIVQIDVPERAAGSAPLFQAVVKDHRLARKTGALRRAVSDPLALSGSWVDDYGYGHDIDDHVWFDFGTYEVERFSNADRSVAARNGPDAFGAGRWSRFDWTTDASGTSWYCQTVYDALTLHDALQAPRSDETDPTVGGCGGAYPGGFAWTRLSQAVLPVTGQWTDTWGDTYTIDDHAWVSDYGTWNVTKWYAARSFLVAHNDAANPYDPGLWSRFDWTTDPAGDLWYCQSVYAALREADAVDALAADPTDPATAGCGGPYPGGFPWTKLGP